MSHADERILSYRIDDQGHLSHRQIIVDKLLSFRNDHTPHGLTKDGKYVYASIGHPNFHKAGRDYVTCLSTSGDGGGFVVDLLDYETLTPTRIFSNAGHYSAAIPERDRLLCLITYRGRIHVINPGAAPIKARGFDE